MRRPRRPGVVALFVLLPMALAGTAVAVLRGGGEPRRIVLVAAPHPDDEAQAWALLEREKDAYVVFVVMTLGEATNFCAPELPGFDEGTGEAAPTPAPAGRNSDTCAEARYTSMLRFIEAAGEATGVVPAELGRTRTVGPLGAPDGVCRKDDTDSCTERDTEARVVTGDRGAIVAFDLGDGDLTEEETRWALRTTIDNREALGIDASLPVERVIAAAYYWDDASFAGCLAYPHPDHKAVADAVYAGGFGVSDRAGATCAGDDRASLQRDITDRSWDALFEVRPDGTRVGAHPVSYGWLLDPYYPADETGQATLFHREQSYWVRSD